MTEIVFECPTCKNQVRIHFDPVKIQEISCHDGHPKVGLMPISIAHH